MNSSATEGLCLKGGHIPASPLKGTQVRVLASQAAIPSLQTDADTCLLHITDTRPLDIAEARPLDITNATLKNWTWLR